MQGTKESERTDLVCQTCSKSNRHVVGSRNESLSEGRAEKKEEREGRRTRELELSASFLRLSPVRRREDLQRCGRVDVLVSRHLRYSKASDLWWGS